MPGDGQCAARVASRIHLCGANANRPTHTAALNHWGFSAADVLRELGLDIRRVLHASEEFEYPARLLSRG